MRDVDRIWSAWRALENGNAWTGDTEPSTRVTVEPSFWLRTTDPVLGRWKRGPARWFQRADTTDQVEIDIPKIESVTISRGLDTDAASCDIVLTNVADQAYGEEPVTPGQFGEAGAYTWDHGAAPEARARWGHVTNAWANILVTNALIRVYQGFGGKEKSLDDAIEDGHVVLNGIFLVDTVAAGSDGVLHLKCRDMAKLLIDQQLFPPLVPASQYPLAYRRYTYQGFAIPADPPPSSTPHTFSQANFYGDGANFTTTSSSDQFYGGHDTAVAGHRPSDALDWGPTVGDQFVVGDESYWLSEPYGNAVGGDVFPYFEFALDASLADQFHQGLVNVLHVHPWGGNYQCFVSIWENGGWVAPEAGGGGGIIPADDPDVAIPYVYAAGTMWEAAISYYLPRVYFASKIRVTFTNLTGAPEGGFRAGLRKVVGAHHFTDGSEAVYSFTAAGYPHNEDNKAGYWQARSNGRIYAFGDAHTFPANEPTPHSHPVVGMCATADGQGYLTIDTAGLVKTYGNATHHGDLSAAGNTDVVDMALTPSGAGYWILQKGGYVTFYGDAEDHGQLIRAFYMPSGAFGEARSIESHPTDQGYWILWSDGQIDTHGLTDYGDANRTGFKVTEYVASVRRTSTGEGYWITSGQGIVQAFGDAPHPGNAEPYPEERWVEGLCWDLIPYSLTDNGYGVQYADGHISPQGDFEYFGSVGDGTGQLRLDGNYKDYTDIVRELLLWAGFYLYRDPQPGAEMPDVYGNLENTGAFAREDLPKDMFDKKPVMDAIRSLKEIVGYLFWVDEEGAARFESPNWWTMGNFDQTGQPLNLMPEIDESVQMLDHGIEFGDSNTRSEIIIATQDPYPSVNGLTPPKGVVQTRVIPHNVDDLKGIVKPAMWTNGLFIDPEEQQVMADLIAMHIWFARRVGQVSCVANPLIGINDQVRVIERTTGEVYVHYIRNVTITHNYRTGEFTMELTTHWMGGAPYRGSDGQPLGGAPDWVIVSQNAYDQLADQTDYVPVTPRVRDFLTRTSSPSANNAAVANFGDPVAPTTKVPV